MRFIPTAVLRWAELVREHASAAEIDYLQWHSPWGAAWKETVRVDLVECDRASFDPLYPTPTLDEMVPYLERFYGLGKDLV